MFSKSRINEPGAKPGEADKPKAPEAPVNKPSMDFTPSAPKGKVAASVLSADLTVVGNLRTTGDIQVEGTVEGDIRAHLLTVGESATNRLASAAAPIAPKTMPRASRSTACPSTRSTLRSSTKKVRWRRARHTTGDPPSG